ncbi:MAG: DUF1858 domain-containing protein [Syntrophobacterales bacterium]|jgi:hybrid cluster-associated redox disulfide protein|nr:DUF1858 domain-containing protein [Syntrophobacterales bacterium]
MAKKEEKIEREMSIEDTIENHPEVVPVFERHGLRCAGCKAALFENIEQGAKIYGIDMDVLLADLNVAISED